MTGDVLESDASLDAAVERIMAKGAEALGDGPKRPDTRENRLDREPHEMDEGVELDPERIEAEAPEAEKAEQEPVGEEEQFLEIPRGEGEEPEKIPLTEAMQAVQQIRQMQGDIASAVIKAETEAYQKQDYVLQKMAEIYDDTQARAQAALHMMQSFMPQPPARSMLDQSSSDYDPQGYYAAKAHFDEFVQYARNVENTVRESMQGKQSLGAIADAAQVERENARLARYIPAWGKPETRDAKRAEIEGVLAAKYGITKDLLDGVIDHRAWRMMADLAETLSVNNKAPEIKKAIQEKAPKLVRGRLPNASRDTQGRFVNEDRAALKKSGSEDDFARMLLRSGQLKNL